MKYCFTFRTNQLSTRFFEQVTFDIRASILVKIVVVVVLVAMVVVVVVKVIAVVVVVDVVIVVELVIIKKIYRPFLSKLLPIGISLFHNYCLT